MDSDVAFVLYRDTIGGAETHTVALARQLAHRGVRVSVVFLFGGPATMTSFLRENDVPTCLLGYRRGLHVLFSPRRLVQAIDNTIESVFILPSNGIIVPALRLGGFKGKIVAFEHGDVLNVSLLPWTRRVWYRIARGLGSPLLDCELAGSQAAADGLEGFSHAKTVKVLHYGVDMDKFLPAPAVGEPTGTEAGPVVFGAAARLVGGKGLGVLVDAAAQLAARGDRAVADWRVVIAGDGPERETLVTHARALGLEERVTFVGPVSDMVGFWQRADVGIFPSKAWVESFGLSSAESLACGCRVLVTDCAASREVLAGCPGVAFLPPGDAGALASHMAQAADSGRTSHTSRLARHSWIAARFPLSRTADGYYELISTLRMRASSGRPS